MGGRLGWSYELRSVLQGEYKGWTWNKRVMVSGRRAIANRRHKLRPGVFPGRDKTRLDKTGPFAVGGAASASLQLRGQF